MPGALPNREVCVLSASTFSHEGGIQKVTRMLLRCLRDACPGTAINLLSLYDSDSQRPCGMAGRADTEQLAYRPCASSRVRFARLALRDMLRKPPRLVIADHAHLSVLPWSARRLAAFPVVFFTHYAELLTLSRLRQRARRRADLIIAVSEFTAQTSRNILGPGCPVKVCPLGLHPEYAGWAARRKPTPRALVGRRPVLIVGRLADCTRDKGHESLIRALPALIKRVPDCLLVIVGRGKDEPRLRSLCAALGVADHVHFAGYVPDEDLPSYYEASEVFAMPSTSEGFGLAYLEAMYHGKPCISGNRDGAREVVRHGETGLLVEPGNVQELKNALLRLLLEPAAARRLGTAGRVRLQECFTYDHFAARLTGLLAPYLPLAQANGESQRHETYVCPWS